MAKSSPLFRRSAFHLTDTGRYVLKMKIPRDIEAEIYFLLPEEGGISTPAFNKYRPRFYYNNNDWDAQHEYPDTEKVYRGKTVTAYLGFMSPQEHTGKIYEGMEFLIHEEARTVGRGKVTEILELKALAKYHAENT